MVGRRIALDPSRSFAVPAGSSRRAGGDAGIVDDDVGFGQGGEHLLAAGIGSDALSVDGRFPASP